MLLFLLGIVLWLAIYEWWAFVAIVASLVGGYVYVRTVQGHLRDSQR